MPPEYKLDLGLQFGPYDLSLEKLKQNPHGIDLGPLQSLLPGRLKQKINLCPSILAEDLKRLETEKINFIKNDTEDFWLIGRRTLRDNNSWMHNVEKLMKGKNRCTLLINNIDAQKNNFKNGESIIVKSRVGQVIIPIEITDEIMPGVVSIPHGYGHNRKGIKLKTAEKYVGISINDLSDEKSMDELTGNSAFSGVKVKLYSNILEKSI
jgi:anaerobic selenocysteine-containing dehydrogenase